MSIVRIGFVGAGAMGQCAHLRNYARIEGCQVVALAELRPELSGKVAERYGVPRLYRDHRDMLEKEKLDAIVAIQPFQIHGQLLPDLVASGLPVMIEKPLARSQEVGERIVDAMQRHGARVFVGYHKRSDPAVVWVKEKIAQWKSSGKMGAMTLVRITMPPGEWTAGGFSELITTSEPYPKLAVDEPPAWMDEPTARRHESFVNFYIHQLNLMRHLLGESYEVQYVDSSGVVMVVRSASGVTGVFELGAWRTTSDWQERVLVAFEKGWTRIELPAPLASEPGRVTVFEDAENPQPRTSAPHVPQVHAMRQQAESFVAAVGGVNTPLCTAIEALEDLRIADAYVKLLARM